MNTPSPRHGHHWFSLFVISLAAVLAAPAKAGGAVVSGSDRGVHIHLYDHAPAADGGWRRIHRHYYSPVPGSCRVVNRTRYWRGRQAGFSHILCRDHSGRPYVLPASRYLIRHHRH